MGRTLIKEALANPGKKVEIKGWVQNIRNQGSIAFLELRDRTGLMQAVILKDNSAFKNVSDLSNESVVAVTGQTKEEKQAPGGVELAVESIELLSHADPELPIPINEKGTGETNRQSRLDWRWLDLRKPRNLLIFQVWTEMERAFRDHLIKREFILIHSPKFMSTASESGAELFEVKYFKRKAFLAQSPQFYKQMAQAAGFEGIFEVGPVFRANPSFTSRHDTEFTGYDVEFSFIDSHQDVMQLEAELLKDIVEAINKKYGKQIETVFERTLKVPKLPFPQMTLQEAKRVLAEKKVPSDQDDDLNPEEERALSKYILEKEGHEFVFVTDYPISIRPFYHMRHEDDPKKTKSFDLLWNGLEITTGAQREHRYEILKKQAAEKGLGEESLTHYLNFFKYGCPPHGGFGLGPSRMLMKVLDVDNVREVTYLYRGVKRLTP